MASPTPILVGVILGHNFGDKNHRFHLPAKQCGGVSALQSPEIVYRCLTLEIRWLSTYQSPQVLRNIANL